MIVTSRLVSLHLRTSLRLSPGFKPDISALQYTSVFSTTSSMDSPSFSKIIPNNEGWYEPKGLADKMSSGYGEERILVLLWLMVASLGLTGHLAATRTSANLGVVRSPMWKSSIVVFNGPFQISTVGGHPRYSVLAVSGGSCCK